MAFHPVSIAFHSQSIGFGGGERQLATLALALDPTRWKVHVIFQRPGGPWQARFEDAGIRLHQLKLNSYFGPSAIREALRLRRYFRDQRVRICHGFDFTANVFVTPIAASTPGVIALSTQRCETRLIPPKYKFFTRIAHKVSSGIVVNSRMVGEHLASHERYRPESIHVLPNAIDTNNFRPEPRVRLKSLPEVGLVIGAVCVLRPEKNLQTLIRSFASILPQHPTLRLVLVGDGPEKTSLVNLVTELNLSPNVFFLPATDKVPEVLRSIDIFVLPSISESLSNSLMEAMSCGCAALATNLASNLELLPANQHHLAFSALDVEALSRNLLQLIGNAELRSACARDGSNSIHSNFSIPAVVEQLESLYTRLLGENRTQ